METILMETNFMETILIKMIEATWKRLEVFFVDGMNEPSRGNKRI